MELRVLGAVTLVAGSSMQSGGPPRQSAVLAALAVDAGRLVTVDTLVNRAWGADPPQRARRTLHTYVARIRRLLEQTGEQDGETVRLIRRTGGYLLDVNPDQVDLQRFRSLLDRSHDSGCDATSRARLLAEGLSLWRGHPLAGVPGQWAERIREGLRRQHLDATVAWALAELEAGNPGAPVAALSELVEEYPLEEPPVVALMRALYATGHTAEALARYSTTRRRLVEELGVDPSAELRAVHQTILRDSPGGVAADAATATTAVDKSPPRPAQLPADVPVFVGRAEPLAQLDAMMPTAVRPPAPVVISVSGTAGVGKTALAVHWGHRARAEFPDGQLYVNLRGFDPKGPVSPTEVIRGFLHALGVTSDWIPADSDAQVALYRSLLDGRRVLLVLDNARDSEQVRSLLPGSPTVMTVVTSRKQLTGLIAAGAVPLTLDLFTEEDAQTLLARRLGAVRVAAERDAAARIVAHCARLPLALVIAAVRAGMTGFPLGAIADELADARGRLDALATDDPMGQVRVVFGWSYALLTSAAARLFRLLGLHPGPDICLPAAASLHGLPPTRTRALLAELTQAGLLTEPLPGRYAFHDLLRAYALELAYGTDADHQRRTAVVRTLDHYLHTACTASRLLNPHRNPPLTEPAGPAPGVSPERPSDHAQALAWFAAEHQVLLGVLRLAADVSEHHRTWHLVWGMDPFLYWHGHWPDLAASWEVALQASRELGDLRGQAQAHRSIARALIRQGRFDTARSQLSQAYDFSILADDPAARAGCHEYHSYICERLGEFDQALDHSHEAYTLYRTAGHRRGEADALNLLGWYHSLLGRHEPALTYSREAFDLYLELGDREGQAAAWNSIGHAHWQLGHHRQAAEYFGHAIDLWEELGDHYNEAAARQRLGDVHHSHGDLVAARANWERALAIFTDLDHPDATVVSARLDALASPIGRTT